MCSQQYYRRYRRKDVSKGLSLIGLFDSCVLFLLCQQNWNSCLIYHLKSFIHCRPNYLHVAASWRKTQLKMCILCLHLENDRDVSAYSGGRRLLSRAQLVFFFFTRSKRNTGIGAQRMRLAACIFGRAQWRHTRFWDLRQSIVFNSFSWLVSGFGKVW